MQKNIKAIQMHINKKIDDFLEVQGCHVVWISEDNTYEIYSLI